MQFFTRRPSVVSSNGMVATSETQAAVAGMKVLQEGGNAVDAAVATSAVLCVTEPMSTGLGGDMFALMWSAKDHKVTALNGSGRAGRAPSQLVANPLPRLLYRSSPPRLNLRLKRALRCLERRPYRFSVVVFDGLASTGVGMPPSGSKPRAKGRIGMSLNRSITPLLRGGGGQPQ